jgi:hypothetical protein
VEGCWYCWRERRKGRTVSLLDKFEAIHLDWRELLCKNLGIVVDYDCYCWYCDALRLLENSRYIDARSTQPRAKIWTRGWVFSRRIVISTTSRLKLFSACSTAISEFGVYSVIQIQMMVFCIESCDSGEFHFLVGSEIRLMWLLARLDTPKGITAVFYRQ